MTIMHASWGSGKTYFLEQCYKWIYTNKRENKNIITDAIYIDAWKFSSLNANDIMREFFLAFAKELFSFLEKTSFCEDLNQEKSNENRISKYIRKISAGFKISFCGGFSLSVEFRKKRIKN